MKKLLARQYATIVPKAVFHPLFDVKRAGWPLLRIALEGRAEFTSPVAGRGLLVGRVRGWGTQYRFSWRLPALCIDPGEKWYCVPHLPETRR